MDISGKLSNEFKVERKISDNIIKLIDEGNTIPFIARYRKEMTNSMDDQVLREFADRHKYLEGLEQRKQEIRDSIEEQGKMTDEILSALAAAETLAEIEDIYRPYKQKRKTRASVAIEKGLQPLAELMLLQEVKDGDVRDYAKEYVNSEKGVNNEDEAIKGACDIIAEVVSDDAEIRKLIREFTTDTAEISTKLIESDKSKTYEMYADYKESVGKIPPHRILAINRGEKEGCLKVSLEVDEEKCKYAIVKYIVTGRSIFNDYVTLACEDAYDRLIADSIEREIRSTLTDKASEQAIKMFEVNLVPLLMQPTIKGKRILSVDPAYRTGCKIAVIDEKGDVLDTAVVYPTPPQSKVAESEKILAKLIIKHKVDIIAIGNGTASKEAEIFISNLIKKAPVKLSYAMVNEAGASVYSASKLGATEFPEYDVSLRSAISIARRLMDPLSELIKIDVKSIGVGQYQHDMPQGRLTEVLEGVVEDCVNSVGVDVNTASVSLLTYVAGLNAASAKNIIEYRKRNEIKSREELMSINRIGIKAFEQCAGFLRIPDGDNILDNTAVHPESYEAVEKLLKTFDYTAEDVKNNSLGDLKSKIARYGVDKLADQIGVGVFTLNDIVDELLKPGRDIRDSMPEPVLRSDLLDLSDLKEGMELIGTVRNVIDFGAFIDIGVHQDGLAHISQIADGYIKHPSEVLTVGQTVAVKVLGVNVQKKQIALTLKTAANPNGLKVKSKQNSEVEAVNRKRADDSMKQLMDRFSKKR
ncbi:MAG: Tex family protein [Clostridia bacterium]|nr:Tex family protein [Clostridia bacterium]